MEHTTVSRTRLAQRAGDSRVVLLTVLAVGVAYVGWRLGRGWIPVDDGALGQTAERVLRGEVPHRDFDDVYTGGLAYLNAAAFRVFGTTLWTLRLVLLAFFVAWLPAVYYVASRFTRPLAAGAATLLAVVWSLPNYPAAMPSWYNLFFATFGVAALLRYVEDGRRRWLVVAGIAGGLSFLVKIVGLYYIGGALLFLLFQAHAESVAPAARARRARLYAVAVTGVLTLFVAALVTLVRLRLFASEVVHFVVPGALVAGVLMWNEWTVGGGSSRRRFGSLVRLVAPFVAGVAIPIAIFVLPYLRADAVGALVNGALVLPAKRFGFAEARMLPLWTTVATLPLVALVVAATKLRVGARWSSTALIVLPLVALFVATLLSDIAYRFVWYSARNVPLVIVVAGAVAIVRARPADNDMALHRARLVLLVAMTALCGLIQFPYAAANYFCYVAPLAVLGAVALLRSVPTLPPLVPVALVAFYAAFAVARTNGSPLYQMGERYLAPLPSEPLALDRAGIDIPSYQAPVYRALIATLRQRARSGYTWASPDCPEIYFLSGLSNPTRSLYDFFDDPDRRTARLLGALESHRVSAIVLNRIPSFSPPLTMAPDLVAALEQRYPYAADFGPFQLRWRA